MPTSASICTVHLRMNSSSVKRRAEMRARWRTARGSGRERAFSKASTNSSAVLA